MTEEKILITTKGQSEGLCWRALPHQRALIRVPLGTALSRRAIKSASNGVKRADSALHLRTFKLDPLGFLGWC